jgi:hypothetical protein
MAGAQALQTVLQPLLVDWRPFHGCITLTAAAQVLLTAGTLGSELIEPYFHIQHNITLDMCSVA